MRNTLRTAVAMGLVGVVSGCGRKQAAPVPDPVVAAPTQEATPVARPATPTEAAAAPVNRRAILEQRIHFEYNRSDLTPEAQAILTAKAEVLRAVPGTRVRIEGHADERGSDEYNMVLSRQRAVVAKRFLAQLGVEAERLETLGFGEEQPIDAGSNERAWAANRRADFRITTSFAER